jgi:Ca2+-binding EF-hand superfamily protein
MKSYKKALAVSAAVLALGMVVSSAQAQSDTVTTKTMVVPKEIPNINRVDFAEFDLNNDGVLSMEEVGEKLFYLFDNDGNHVIDNIEFTNRKVMTIVPMEKHTYTYIDHNSTGTVDKTKYTHETFYEQSMLARFDDDVRGLSPESFIGHSFLEMDTNRDGAVDIHEWKAAYIKSVLPEVAKQERYNQ